MGRSRYPEGRYAAIEQAVAGTTTIVPGQAGRRIIVLAYALTISSDGTIQFRSGANPRTGAMDIIGKGGAVVPEANSGWFEADEGEDLVLVTTGGAANGHLTYVVED